MEEAEHLISVISGLKDALKRKDSDVLRLLSDQTIHHASTHSEEACITLAVLNYVLSKLIERKDYLKINNWERFSKKMSALLDLSVISLKQNKQDKFNKYLEMARKLTESISINLKPYIIEVFRKASINKASKIYEHGISMGKTAKMLGVTQWELYEYSGQKKIADNEYNQSLNVRSRAKMAIEFFR
jgi:hypothetical protein